MSDVEMTTEQEDAFFESGGNLPDPEPQAPEPEAPEPQAAEAPVEPEATTEDKVVPLNALNEARAKMRMQEKELESVKSQLEELKTIKQRIDEAAERVRERQQAEEFERDPLNALNQKVDSLRQQQEKTLAQQQQEREQSEQMQQLQQAVAVRVEQYMAEKPDYPQALEHLMQVRVRERMITEGLTQEQAVRYVDQEAVGLAQTALQRGENPADVVYQLAQMRGYAPQSAPVPESVPDAPVESPQSAAEKQLKTIEKGQSQQGLRGGVGEVPSALDVDNMTEEELDALWKEMEAADR